MRNSLAALVTTLSFALPSFPSPNPLCAPLPPSISPIPSSVNRHQELRQLRGHLENTFAAFTYQMQETLIPLFHYGMLHPEKLAAHVACTSSTCDLYLTFNGAAQTVPGVEEYEDTHESLLALMKRGEELGLPPFSEVACPLYTQTAEIGPSPLCVPLDPLPRLTVLEGNVILTLTRPQYDCTKEIPLTGFKYGIPPDTFLTIFFPSCYNLPPEEVTADLGYEVTGSHVRGLHQELLPGGISLTLPLRSVTNQTKK